MIQDAGCPLCGENNLSVQYILADPTYRTAQCRACDFVFMNPYPSDSFLQDYYRSRVLYGTEGGTKEHFGRAIDDRRRLIENLLTAHGARLRDGYALDFGAGAGIAVAALDALGFEAIGIEENPQSPATALRLFGVKIVNKELGDVPDGIRLFTIFEVLEHIKYPKRFLATVHERLAPDACIIGSVPNYTGIGRYLNGTSSIALAFPEHVNQFTKRTLNRTLAESGFEVLYIGFPPPYGVSLTLGFRKYLENRYSLGISIRRLISVITFLKKFAIYPPLNIFAERTGFLGHGLVFMARKR